MIRIDPASEVTILRSQINREDEWIANLLYRLETIQDIASASYDIRMLAESRGIEVVGTYGDLVPYDHNIHRCGGTVKPGDDVRVVTLPVVKNSKDGKTTITFGIVESMELYSAKWVALDAERAEAKRKAEAEEAEKKRKEEENSRQISSELNADRAAFNLLMQMQQGKKKRK